MSISASLLDVDFLALIDKCTGASSSSEDKELLVTALVKRSPDVAEFF